MKKILFLDFDGVMVTDRYQSSLQIPTVRYGMSTGQSSTQYVWKTYTISSSTPMPT